jgi:DNA-binding NarL/FixJ family response regulator
MRDFLEDKMAIRIILADDADMMILGMKTVLESDHRYAVVGTARSIGELLCVAKSEPTDLIIFNEFVDSARGRRGISNLYLEVLELRTFEIFEILNVDSVVVVGE